MAQCRVGHAAVDDMWQDRKGRVHHVAQPVIRAGVETFMRIDQANAGPQVDKAAAEIAAKQKFVSPGRLRPAADFPAAYLAKGLIECRRRRGGA
jgi:hypothetical protein